MPQRVIALKLDVGRSGQKLNISDTTRKCIVVKRYNERDLHIGLKCNTYMLASKDDIGFKEELLEWTYTG